MNIQIFTINYIYFMDTAFLKVPHTSAVIL